MRRSRLPDTADLPSFLAGPARAFSSSRAHEREEAGDGRLNCRPSRIEWPPATPAAAASPARALCPTLFSYLFKLRAVWRCGAELEGLEVCRPARMGRRPLLSCPCSIDQPVCVRSSCPGLMVHRTRDVEKTPAPTTALPRIKFIRQMGSSIFAQRRSLRSPRP